MPTKDQFFPDQVEFIIDEILKAAERGRLEGSGADESARWAYQLCVDARSRSVSDARAAQIRCDLSGLAGSGAVTRLPRLGPGDVKVGDVVKLMSGGPRMTVFKVTDLGNDENSVIHVQWFSGSEAAGWGEINGDQFHISLLDSDV